MGGSGGSRDRNAAPGSRQVLWAYIVEATKDEGYPRNDAHGREKHAEDVPKDGLWDAAGLVRSVRFVGRGGGMRAEPRRARVVTSAGPAPREGGAAGWPNRRVVLVRSAAGPARARAVGRSVGGEHAHAVER